MIRFADVTSDTKSKKAAPPPAPQPAAPEAVAPKPARTPRKKKSA